MMIGRFNRIRIDRQNVKMTHNKTIVSLETKDGTSFGPYNVILTKYGEGAPIGTLYFTVASSKD